MNNNNAFPDYYIILGINESANSDEIRTAYKKKSLTFHPDRLPAGASDLERKESTIMFQSISDAYYTLSDSSRRRSYDITRSQQPKESRSGDANSSSNYFDLFSNFATAAAAAGLSGNGNNKKKEQRPNAEFVFGDVFEDLLRPELEKGSGIPIWRVIGACSGAAIGFIAGNLPGAALGGYAGNKLGSIRDAKGKAVYEVFKDLGADQKAEVLKGLAAKVFGMAGIGGSGNSNTR